MSSYVLDTLAGAQVRQGVVVTGPEGSRIAKRLLEDPPDFPVRFVEQKLDRGNGDAVLIGLSGFDDFNDEEDVLIVPGDIPLLRPETIELLLDAHHQARSACTVLAVDAAAAPDLPRVMRDRHGRVSAIAALGGDDEDGAATGFEARLAAIDAGLDPNEARATSTEAATGVFCVRRGLLAPALRRTGDEAGIGQVQLIDVVGVLASSGHACHSVVVDEVHDLTPVGNRLQLAEAEAELRRRTNRYWLARGVTMVDPDRTYIDATVTLGTDVTIFPGTILQGNTTIGDGCELGPDTRLDRCEVGKGVRIEKATATLATIGDECTVGPFAVLPPGTNLAPGTTTGPFYPGS